MRFHTLLAVLGLSLWGCTSSTGGISAIQPFPDGGTYSGQKTDNMVNIRLSEDGLNYLNSDWESLVEAFAPGQVLEIPFPCTESSFPVLNDVAIGDQGSLPDGGVCEDESCGQLDGKCDTQDAPQIVKARVVDFSLSPSAPDQLVAGLSIEIDTGDIFVSETRGSAICIGGRIKCSVEVDTAREAPNRNTVRAGVRFFIDQKWDKLLSFELTTIEGAAVCGSTGALPPPDCIDPKDLDISGENLCGGIYCGLADWAPVKNAILRRLSPLLEEQIRAQLATQLCVPCGTGLPACPMAGAEASVCTEGICKDATTQKCVPRLLGVEGRVNAAQTLSAFGVPPNASVDLSVAAGSSVVVDKGVSMGTRGGVQAVNVASCVSPEPAPVYNPIPAPNFDGEAPAGEYHVGLGFSQPFLDLAMYHAQQSGALCLSIGSETVGLLNTELFGRLLPSLSRLATRDGKHAPMRAVFKPGKPPTVRIGAGTVDPVTQKPIDALLTLAMRDATIDLYAAFDDRQARLFTLTADIFLPLSVIFEGCSGVKPALGDLKKLITNVRTANSEILAEDPRILSDLIPALVGFAEPAIASSLSAFSLPELGAFKLKVTGTKGLGNSSGTGTYTHLGVFARLLPADAACAISAPRTSASLHQSRMPSQDEMVLSGRGLPWPVAVLNVAATGVSEEVEFAYRVNGGLWSTYRPAVAGLLEVSHPSFILEGQHHIEVRSRVLQRAGTESAPVGVPFVVDWSAPEVQLVKDAENNRLLVKTRDTVTAPENLQFSYQLANDAESPFGAPRLVDLAAVEKAGGLTVKVRDATGNIGQASYRAPRIDEGRTLPDTSESAGGCHSTGQGWLHWSLAFLVLGVGRRRTFR